MKKVKGNTFVTSLNNTDIGIYRFGRNSAVLIDSGREEQPEFIDWLKEQGISPVAVINTHLHIDHIGCNELLKKEFQCNIYASSDEIRHENDAGYTAGKGAISNPDSGILEICGHEFEIIPTPGHSCGHQAVVTPDGVCFLGDVVMSEEILKSSKMPYHLDIDAALDSMDKVKKMDYSMFVLSHEGCFTKEQIVETVGSNLAREEYFRNVIGCLCDNRISDDKLTTLFMNEIGITGEKQDVFWVWETAHARVKSYRRKI